MPRDPTVSLYDHFLADARIQSFRHVLIERQFGFDSKNFKTPTPSISETLFALDHRNIDLPVVVKTCCSRVHTGFKMNKQNLEFYLGKNVMSKLRKFLPFESCVITAQVMTELCQESPISKCLVTNCVCKQTKDATPETKQEPKPILVATDFDGTFGSTVNPKPPSKPTLCITGRTFHEFNDDIKDVANTMPVYIRGTGAVGDAHHAARFKATMIKELGVTHFLEDDPVQITIIHKICPEVVICRVVEDEEEREKEENDDDEGDDSDEDSTIAQNTAAYKYLQNV